MLASFPLLDNLELQGGQLLHLQFHLSQRGISPPVHPLSSRTLEGAVVQVVLDPDLDQDLDQDPGLDQHQSKDLIVTFQALGVFMGVSMGVPVILLEDLLKAPS